MDLRCDCPLLARSNEELGADVRCVYPVDGEDGLCSMCRAICLEIVAFGRPSAEVAP